jgi:hypothetical protein
VAKADEAIEAQTRGFDGKEFIISRRRWGHILDRHPELATMANLILGAASFPDEAFEDPRGLMHLVKSLKGGASDYLVLIVRSSGMKDYLVTAYLIGAKRKTRRYRKFKRLRLS